MKTDLSNALKLGNEFAANRKLRYSSLLRRLTMILCIAVGKSNIALANANINIEGQLIDCFHTHGANASPNYPQDPSKVHLDANDLKLCVINTLRLNFGYDPEIKNKLDQAPFICSGGELTYNCIKEIKLETFDISHFHNYGYLYSINIYVENDRLKYIYLTKTYLAVDGQNELQFITNNHLPLPKK
jgi:hypothetical protein